MRAGPAATVRIDCRRISDGATFHHVFAAALGFPDYYGRNMNAWIDVMSDPDVVARHACGGVLVLVLDGCADFERRLPGLWLALLECACAVNARGLGDPEAILLVLADGVA